jgi:hypothetical protein
MPGISGQLRVFKKYITPHYKLGKKSRIITPWCLRIRHNSPGRRDELERFVVKKNKIWLGIAVNDFQPGILGLALGDRACRNFSLIVGSTSVTGNVIFMLHIDNLFIPGL